LIRWILLPQEFYLEIKDKKGIKRRSASMISSTPMKVRKTQEGGDFYAQAQLQETSNQRELQRKMFEVEHLIYNQCCSQYKSDTNC